MTHTYCLIQILGDSVQLNVVLLSLACRIIIRYIQARSPPPPTAIEECKLHPHCHIAVHTVDVFLYQTYCMHQPK